MIEPNGVLHQARAGMAPPYWQVLRAKPGYFLLGAFGYAVLAFASIAAAVYIVLSGTVFGYGINDGTPDGVLNFWFIVDLVFLALVLIAGIVLAVGRLLRLRGVGEQMLVILPEGVVIRRGFGPTDLWSFNFPNIRQVTWNIRKGQVYLTFLSAKDTRVVHYTLDGRYGNPKKVAQQIQNAHAQYVGATMRTR